MRAVAGGILLIGISASVSAQQSAGFTQLFDGKTLSGWTVENQYAKNFSVRDGLLRIEGVGGWLKSTRQYSDFTLRVEFRYLTEDPVATNSRGAVSGIFLRTPGTSMYGSGWPSRSLEVQLGNRPGIRPAFPGDARWGGAVLYHDIEGGPSTFDTETALRTYGKTGDWQTYEVQAIGNTVTVLLNDRFLGRASAGGNAKGFIGLQAESGAIEFRSIAISEGAGPIPPRSSDGFVSLFDGKTLNGWKLSSAQSKTYSVQDGLLTVTGRPTRGVGPDVCVGNLFSERQYGDFTLRFQARFVTGLSDSGFLVRVPSISDGRAYQIQLQGMEEKNLPWNATFFRQGNVPQGEGTFDFAAAMRAYSKVGEWTSYELQALGKSATVKVNGIVVARAENMGVSSGLLGIQCEVNVVHLRDIEIREEQIQ